MKAKTFREEIYGHDFLVLYGTEEERPLMDKRLNRFFMEDGNEVDEGFIGLCFYCGNLRKLAIVLAESDNQPHLAGTIAHEALHATQHIFRWCEAAWDISQGKHEPQCYLHAWIVRKIHQSVQ